MGNGTAATPEIDRTALVEDRKSVPDRFLALEFMTYMCDDILTKVDRSSMLNSLEVRAPLLDHRVVEFAFRKVPGTLKVHAGERKRILRKLAGKLLPPSFDSSRKQGFSIPIGDWMTGAWKPLISDLLDKESPLFKRNRVERILRRSSASDRGSHRIFQLAMLEAWRRHYGIEV
jgi:asparagine synthase (glutamine-hydrolysing)